MACLVSVREITRRKSVACVQDAQATKPVHACVQDAQAIIFVIDCSDKLRMCVVKEELQVVLLGGAAGGLVRGS
jgi:hypothetical protein